MAMSKLSKALIASAMLRCTGCKCRLASTWLQRGQHACSPGRSTGMALTRSQALQARKRRHFVLFSVVIQFGVGDWVKG